MLSPPPPAPGHTVQFYDGEEGLVRAVAAFAAEGLHDGDAVLVVSTGARLGEIERAIGDRGADPAPARRDGRLVLEAAEETLAGIVTDGALDASRFRAVVGAAVERALAASRSGRLRAYGELANLLWDPRNPTATIEIEQWWNQLAAERRFGLLCAYPVEGFASHERESLFREICSLHASVVPSGDHATLPREEQLRRVAELEQRARALEEDVERRKRLEIERASVDEADRLAQAEITLLYRLTDAASRAETLEQVYEVALDGIATALGVPRASILLFDSDGVMRFKAWRGLSDRYRAAVEGHSPWRAEDRNPPPLLSEDVRADPQLADLLPTLEREGIGALGFFPLSTGERLVGKFMVYYSGPHAFTGEEKRIAGAIADQVAFAVDRKLAALERERFVGIVGHDLRTPLGAIRMTAEALLRLGVGEEVGPLVRRILASADRMQRLIEQLVEFSQARHGAGIPVRLAPCDLGRIARHVAEELQAAHPDRALTIDVEGDVSGEWDADRLGEVLSNIVGNAIEHGGGAPVSVRVHGAGPEAIAAVHNEGPPIPPAMLPHLFDPFRRGGGSSRASPHVGLGLFIAREIVVAHGGDIRVRSARGRGTTFEVRLPRAGGRRP